MKLLVATGNVGKLREIRRLLAERPIDIVGLADIGSVPQVIEDGDSFAANATKKATLMARATGLLTLADDSGLVVPALDGAPGVYSARYAGEVADDARNNRKLLDEIHMQALHKPAAYFCCCLALADAQGKYELFEGRVNGVILDQNRGRDGFGYDPLFLVPEYGKTFAELPLEVKNRISHRGMALRQLLAALERFEQGPDPQS